MNRPIRMIILGFVAATAYAMIFAATAKADPPKPPANGAPASEWAEYFRSLPPDTPLNFHQRTEQKTASGAGPQGEASGPDKIEMNMGNMNPPNAQVSPDHKADGGGADINAVAFGGAKLNIFVVLGGFTVLGGIGCLIFAPQFKSIGLGAIAIGGASVALGVLVASPLAATLVLGAGILGLLLWSTKHLGEIETAAKRVVKAVSASSDASREEVKANVDAITTTKDDSVISRLKRS